MARLAPNIPIQFFDIDGKVLASGTIDFHEAFTNKDKTAYSDKAEGSALSNPHTLDTYGGVELRLDEEDTYSLDIKNSDGVTIHTVDDVVGCFEPLQAAYKSNSIKIKSGKVIKDSNGNEFLEFSATTNAVNYLTMANSATGNALTISIDGPNPNSLEVNAKGSGNLLFNGEDTLNETGYSFTTTASAVNHIKSTASATGNDLKLEAAGDDTNVGITVTPKGSGKVVVNSDYSFPTTDGTSGQAVNLTSANTLGFATMPSAPLKGINSGTTAITSGAATPYDDTIPQDAEVHQVASKSHTAASASNKLLVRGSCNFGGLYGADGPGAALCLLKDGTVVSTSHNITRQVAAGSVAHSVTLVVSYYETAGDTSAHTWSLQGSYTNVGGQTLYPLDDNSNFGGNSSAQLWIEEVS